MSDSDSEDGISSDEEEVTKTTTAAPKKPSASEFLDQKNKTLADYEAFEGDAVDGEITDKMKELLALRSSLGMDQDAQWLAADAAKDLEKVKIDNLSPEEKMKMEEENAGDMMAKIRAKQAMLAKKRMEEQASATQSQKVLEVVHQAEEDEEEMAAKKAAERKKRAKDAKKARKKKEKKEKERKH